VFIGGERDYMCTYAPSWVVPATAVQIADAILRSYSSGPCRAVDNATLRWTDLGQKLQKFTDAIHRAEAFPYAESGNINFLHTTPKSPNIFEHSIWQSSYT